MSAAPVMGDTYQRARAVALDDPAEQLLLELLAGYADAGTSPTVATLAALLGGVHARDVDRLLDALVDRGLLKVAWARLGPAGGRAGRGRRNFYELRLPGAEPVRLKKARRTITSKENA